MDRKAIIALIICFALILALKPLSQKLFPDIHVPVSQSANAGAQTTGGTNAANPAYTIPSLSATPTAIPAFSGGPEQTIVLSNANARYTFTSRGGGIQLVELTKYPRMISAESRTNPAAGPRVTLNETNSAPALALVGDASLEGDGIFTLTRTATGVRAEKTLPDGLRIVKEFDPGADYLIQTTLRFENTSGKPLNVSAQELVVGTATPMDPADRGLNVGMMWYDGSKKVEILQSWFGSRGLMCTTTAPRTEYRAGNSNVVWAAAENQYFALVDMPGLPAEQVIARPLELPRPSEGDASVTNNPTQKGIQTVLLYPPFTLSPGEDTEQKITIYAGPKEYKTLARLADHMQNNLDLLMGFSSFMGFGYVSKALLLTMNAIHALTRISYGWVIIAFTVMLKALFWPLTAASMRTSKAMAALQPEMAKLKEKYKDDPLKMQQKTNELWKEHGVHPLNGCLPMAVQIPVFFGLFGMLRTAIELRGASFLWINDLSKPDTIFTIPGLGFIPFIGSTGVGLPVNVLPILYIITALWQTHVTPPSPGMDPAQQKMMRWMPLMFLAFLYKYSSALALYMMVSNILTITQTKLTKHRLAIPSGPGAPPPVLTHPPKKRK